MLCTFLRTFFQTRSLDHNNFKDHVKIIIKTFWQLTSNHNGAYMEHAIRFIIRDHGRKRTPHRMMSRVGICLVSPYSPQKGQERGTVTPTQVYKTKSITNHTWA